MEVGKVQTERKKNSLFPTFYRHEEGWENGEVENLHSFSLKMDDSEKHLLKDKTKMLMEWPPGWMKIDLSCGSSSWLEFRIRMDQGVQCLCLLLLWIMMPSAFLACFSVVQLKTIAQHREKIILPHRISSDEILQGRYAYLCRYMHSQFWARPFWKRAWTKWPFGDF